MEKGIARYLFELGQLKRVRRSGWWVAGVDQPESVADHSFRCAAIAYLLAELEGANPERAAAIALFHDTGETRVNDQHRVGKTYVNWDGAEEKVVEDQLHRLPEHVQFRHNRHIQAGVECQTCHGPVEEIDKLHLVEDSHLGYLVPVAKLQLRRFWLI